MKYLLDIGWPNASFYSTATKTCNERHLSNEKGTEFLVISHLLLCYKLSIYLRRGPHMLQFKGAIIVLRIMQQEYETFFPQLFMTNLILIFLFTTVNRSMTIL